MSGKDLKGRYRVKFAFMVVVGVLTTYLTGFHAVHGADYPTKPITLIVAFPPGGGADITARLVAGYLSKKWGQPINPVNVPGGGAIPGTKQALESKPDGYTILVDVHGNAAMMPAVYENLPFDWRKRTPLARITIDATLYLVNSKSPYKSLADLAKVVKENPQKFSWGGVGPSGLSTFALGQFFDAIGVNILDTKMVALGGTAPALTALAGGHVEFAAGFLSDSYPLLSAGKIRPLAVASDQRLKEIPEIPTVGEAGYPNLDIVGWQGFTGPAGLPQDIVDKWATALKQASRDHEFLVLAEKAKKTVAYLGPEDFKDLMSKDYKKYKDLAMKMNIVIK